MRVIFPVPVTGIFGVVDVAKHDDDEVIGVLVAHKQCRAIRVVGHHDESDLAGFRVHERFRERSQHETIPCRCRVVPSTTSDQVLG